MCKNAQNKESIIRGKEINHYFKISVYKTQYLCYNINGKKLTNIPQRLENKKSEEQVR